MKTLDYNLFTVGGIPTGLAFIGRREPLEILKNDVICKRAAANLVGPTRIGKSALVNQLYEQNQDYPNRLFVRTSMGKFKTAFSFWRGLAQEIKRRLEPSNIWNHNFGPLFSFETSFQKILLSLDNQDAEWFSVYQNEIENILEHIGRCGYQLVLTIDEFDAVERLFDQDAFYYQELREIYDSPQFATSGILVTRRRLQLFEAKCKYISTFHGVFHEKMLTPFSDTDMEDFYDRLNLYDIVVSDAGKERLAYYSGRMPYICCMFADQMVNRVKSCQYYDISQIDIVFKQCLHEINRHYDDLISRLEEDHYMDFIYAISIDSKCPGITKRDIENMCTMGILYPESVNTEQRYYAISKDFMVYLYLKPLKLPIWETMTSCEKQLKSIFQREFPELAAITYQQLQSADGKTIMEGIDTKYPELRLNWTQVQGYCQNLSTRKEFPTVLDVLTLSKVVGIMLKTWNKRFYRYFGGNDNWKLKLEVVSSIRNPMAHAQMEYVSDNELAICMKYCTEIIHIEK